MVANSIPTFILFKNGKVEQTINAANPAALRAAVQKVKTELEAAKEAPKPEARTAEVKEDKPVAGEKTVSGSYGLSSGNSWKMSLN
jgi:thioredoxin 1